MSRNFVTQLIPRQKGVLDFAVNSLIMQVYPTMGRITLVKKAGYLYFKIVLNHKTDDTHFHLCRDNH